MSTSYTPTYVGGICKFCHTGELYQYTEDALGALRCGRCGEPHQAEPTEEKPRTANRRKAT